MISALQQVLGPALIDQLFGTLKRLLLNMDVFESRFPVHVSELRHHHFERDTSLRPKSPEGVPEIVEAESIHIALLGELPPGLDPSCHWPVYIKFLILVC